MSGNPDLNVPEHIDPALTVSFDYRYAPEISGSPWEYLARQTEGPEIFWSPHLGGHWVVARTDLIEEVFRRHDIFSNGSVSIPRPPRPQSIPASMDPPEHGKYRKIISQKIFSPRALASLVGEVDTVGRALIDGIAPKGRCEFVSEFARPLPVSLLLHMLGLPEEVRGTLGLWVRQMFHGHSIDEHLAGYQSAFGFLGRWLDETLRGGAGDTGIVLPAFLSSTIDERALTRNEMHSMVMLLLGAGVDTVTSQMTHVMRYFAENPQARKRVAEEPAIIPRAVEELLRRYGIANIARVVRSDMEYRGITMRAGDMVLCASALAGLDARAFPEPMKVDFDRTNLRQHTPFGSGPHICPGAYLARVVLKAMIGDILPRLPDLRLAPDARLHHVSGITVSLTGLPIEWSVAQ